MYIELNAVQHGDTALLLIIIIYGLHLVNIIAAYIKRIGSQNATYAPCNSYYNDNYDHRQTNCSIRCFQ